MSDISVELLKFLSNDENQINILKSNEDRIMVEAPAGCGKTRTLISKIVFLFQAKRISNPKKILGLTFSVNAAFKMKKEIIENIPKLLNNLNFEEKNISNRILITNYHGFCRHVLGLYGYTISQELKNINEFESIDDSRLENIMYLKTGITEDEAQLLVDYNEAIKNLGIDFYDKNFEKYIKVLFKYFIPNKIITYNGIIICTLYLLKNKKGVLDFYKDLFEYIIVDEYQDTNLLGVKLLDILIDKKSKLIFMGDPLQRIYGFIGAIPDLISKTIKHFKMKEYKLNKNYRFRENINMLTLDKNIRLNAENILEPRIETIAKIPFKLLNTQNEEAIWILKKILELPDHVNVAVLTKQRSNNYQVIIDLFEKNKIEYFYALFSEDDKEYINFHNICLKEFTSEFKKIGKLSKNVVSEYEKKILSYYKENENPIINSLVELLTTFNKRIFNEFSFLDMEEKYELISETFVNKLLKNNIEFIEKRIILSTIHGSKGLEWDYVFLVDMEKFGFPNYYGLCGECQNFSEIRGDKCIFKYNNRLEKSFLEELSVFYVAVTRARKQVYFSSSKYRLNYRGENSKTYISCLLKLSGIETINEEEFKVI